MSDSVSIFNISYKRFHYEILTHRYIERIAEVSSGNDNMPSSNEEVNRWVHKIQEWDPKYFTLSHVPEKHRIFVSKFIRRVIIARMAESPDLANAYHRKLRDVYDTEDKLKNSDVMRWSKEKLIRLLDEVETKLNEAAYLAGAEFTMADVMFIPVLARISVLNLEDEYINSRPNIAKYWVVVRQRPSYQKVIGRYFDGWRKYKTLTKTWCFLRTRSIFRRY